MRTETCKVCTLQSFEYFYQFASKLILIILSYTVTKLVHETQCKMVNGFRCYRALESVSIASALFTALTIYP